MVMTFERSPVSLGLGSTTSCTGAFGRATFDPLFDLDAILAPKVEQMETLMRTNQAAQHPPTTLGARL
jgi:hypothetical protein